MASLSYISMIIFLIIYLLQFDVKALSLPKYGEFDLNIEKFEICQGPKRKDCSIIDVKTANNTCLKFDMTITQNVKPTKVKITAMSNGKLLVRLQADDPCNHLFLRPVLQTMLNANDQCLILKGHYMFTVDLEEIAKSYYNGNFVFGSLTFKSVFYNKECNLSCAIVTVSFIPKNKTKI